MPPPSPPSNFPSQHHCQIRITNPTFSRHVREAPGGEEFLHAAGWTVKVRFAGAEVGDRLRWSGWGAV